MPLSPDTRIDTHIHIHHECAELSLQTLNTKIDNIMASLQQLSEEVGALRQQVTGLQSAIDTEQQQVLDAISGLNTTIAQLQDQIANGATPEQLQGVLDQVTTIRNDLQAAQTDLSATIPDAPAPDGNQPPDQPVNGNNNTPDV